MQNNHNIITGIDSLFEFVDLNDWCRYTGKWSTDSVYCSVGYCLIYFVENFGQQLQIFRSTEFQLGYWFVSDALKFVLAMLLDIALAFPSITFVLFFFFGRFLGYIDKLGVAFEAPSLATGYGGYIAQVQWKLLVILFFSNCWYGVCIEVWYVEQEAHQLVGAMQDAALLNLEISADILCSGVASNHSQIILLCWLDQFYVLLCSI